VPEIFRTRDVTVFVKGIAYTVGIDQPALNAGWAGGQGFQWVDAVPDGFYCGFVDGGRGAGFALVGSEEDSDVLTAMTGQQPKYEYIVLCSGSWILSTRTYERYTYTSRLGGPLVEITYAAGDKLKWSLRGLWTNEDEWTLSGDPRAPNAQEVGYVTQAPTAGARGVPYLGVHTFL
jgi:hypothetical protein